MCCRTDQQPESVAIEFTELFAFNVTFSFTKPITKPITIDMAYHKSERKPFYDAKFITIDPAIHVAIHTTFTLTFAITFFVAVTLPEWSAEHRSVGLTVEWSIAWSNNITQHQPVAESQFVAIARAIDATIDQPKCQSVDKPECKSNGRSEQIAVADTVGVS